MSTCISPQSLLWEACSVSSSSSSSSSSWVIKRWPDKSSRRRIDLEVHQRIKEHPHQHLVRIIDVHPQDGILMDYWSGGDLHKLMTLARRKYLPLRSILSCITDVVNGLEHLHSIKIVHCDVSPQNIFLRWKLKDGKETDMFASALGDFGHSYILNEHEESRSSVADQGMHFIAPEVSAGSVSTMASDVYSAGKILAEMMNLATGYQEMFAKESKTLTRKLSVLSSQMCASSPRARPTSTAVGKMLRSSSFD
mmetsp:Transcript_38067/g.119935  ORF Transcript_38067/g.119935 Transcript_38067/m.119935 type:complete len:252 (-) Transcript_38067:35-790(-)